MEINIQLHEQGFMNLFSVETITFFLSLAVTQPPEEPANLMVVFIRNRIPVEHIITSFYVNLFSGASFLRFNFEFTFFDYSLSNVIQDLFYFSTLDADFIMLKLPKIICIRYAN